MITRPLLAALACLALVNQSAMADIITSGTPGQPGGQVQITTDITYKVTVAGTLYYLVLDNLVASAGPSAHLASSAPNAKVQYQINGGATLSVNFGLFDEFASNTGAVSPEDGLIAFDPIAVNVGDTITFPAQILRLQALPPDFDPRAIGTFKGNSFLVFNALSRATGDIFVNRSREYERQANQQFALYPGQINKALGNYYSYLGLSRYYFFYDNGDNASAEYNKYLYLGKSLRYFLTDLRKPKVGRYIELLYTGIAFRQYYTLKGNPKLGNTLYKSYLKRAQAARR